MKTKAVMKTPKGFAKIKEGIAPEQECPQKEESSAKAVFNAQNAGERSGKMLRIALCDDEQKILDEVSLSTKI